MRVLMTGGGTGGHVNPALAIARTIKQDDPDAEIAYVGTERGIENKLVGRAGYPMYHVEVRGIKRSLSPSNIKAAYLALTSPRKAKKIVREFRPDIVHAHYGLSAITAELQNLVPVVTTFYNGETLNPLANFASSLLSLRAKHVIYVAQRSIYGI